MAKINRATNAIEAQDSLAALASLCMLCCMVVTVVGIKIWWFKHRLTFDQSGTSNGAAGGSQPHVVPRTRSTKDKKRLSQHFREPVMVHGVFRKRQEDELDVVEPAKLLPPVGMRKLSQSTPALFSPNFRPSAEREIFEIPAPPTRQPPAPPTPADFELPEKQSEANQVCILRNAQEMQTDTEQHEVQEMSNETAMRQATLVTEPQRPLRRNRNRHSQQDPETQAEVERKFLRAKQKVEFAKAGNFNLMERRATGFQRPDDNEWQHLQDEYDAEDTVNEEKAIAMQAWEETERRPTSYMSQEEANQGELQNWEDAENLQALKPERRATGYVSQEEAKLRELQDLQQNKETTTKYVHFLVEDKEKDEAKRNEEQLQNHRRPTGYVRDVHELWTTETTEDHSDSDALWQEMERDIHGDFVNNIEEEFNKIRHSYEENEGGFLEEELQTPTGFGKSIDEDWANFEILEEQRGDMPSVRERRPTGYVRELPEDFEEEQEEMVNVKERRPTGFVREVHINVEDFADVESEPTINECRPTGYARPLPDKYNEEVDELHEVGELTATRERRPTGYVRELPEDLENEDNEMYNICERRLTGYPREVVLDMESEDNKTEEEQDMPNVRERRPTGYVRETTEKPEQRVQFNLKDEHDSDNAEIEEAEESQTTQFLKQRRPTGYVRNIDEINVQLMNEDVEENNGQTVEEESYNVHKQHKVQFLLQTADNENTDKDDDDEISSIKQRRPTGFVKREQYMEDNEEIDLENKTEEIMPKRVPKPRQKVTFQLNTKAASSADEDEVNDQRFGTIPTPMQRMSNIRYAGEQNDTTENRAALLFSTQVSAEYAAENENANDSWSAIRQHRSLTEEFQQIRLDERTVEPLVVAPRAAPKAAYRNPLAQQAEVISTEIVDDAAKEEWQSEVDSHKPRTMRDMKKMQSRQMQLVGGGGTTEA